MYNKDTIHSQHNLKPATGDLILNFLSASGGPFKISQNHKMILLEILEWGERKKLI